MIQKEPLVHTLLFAATTADPGSTTNFVLIAVLALGSLVLPVTVLLLVRRKQRAGGGVRDGRPSPTDGAYAGTAGFDGSGSDSGSGGDGGGGGCD